MNWPLFCFPPYHLLQLSFQLSLIPQFLKFHHLLKSLQMTCSQWGPPCFKLHCPYPITTVTFHTPYPTHFPFFSEDLSPSNILYKLLMLFSIICFSVLEYKLHESRRFCLWFFCLVCLILSIQSNAWLIYLLREEKKKSREERKKIWNDQAKMKRLTHKTNFWNGGKVWFENFKVLLQT